MNELILNKAVRAFNHRQYEEAASQAAEGLTTAMGQDEVFWMGFQEACEGFAKLQSGKVAPAEKKLLTSMRILRNFGFRYENFEVTAALAGIRRAVEEIREVRSIKGKAFDVSLLPQLRLAAKADD